MGVKITYLRDQGPAGRVADRDLYLVDGELVDELPAGVGAVVVAKEGRVVPRDVIDRYGLDLDETGSVDADPAEPVHVGGGWYELPDGRRIRGKKNAEEAMK